MLLIVSVFGISALELDWTLGRGENTTGLIKIKKVDEVFMMRSDPHMPRKKKLCWFPKGSIVMLVPKGRDVLIEQKPALKLWPTIKLKRHRPMFVECTLALRWWQILDD